MPALRRRRTAFSPTVRRPLSPTALPWILEILERAGQTAATAVPTGAAGDGRGKRFMRDTSFDLPVCGLAVAASATGLNVLVGWASLFF